MLTFSASLALQNANQSSAGGRLEMFAVLTGGVACTGVLEQGLVVDVGGTLADVDVATGLLGEESAALTAEDIECGLTC